MTYDYIVYKDTKKGPKFVVTFLLATMTTRWTNEYPDAGRFTDLIAQAVARMVRGKAIKASDYGCAE